MTRENPRSCALTWTFNYLLFAVITRCLRLSRGQTAAYRTECEPSPLVSATRLRLPGREATCRSRNQPPRRVSALRSGLLP